MSDQQIRQLEKRIGKQFEQMHDDFVDFRNDVNMRLQPLHDFMVGQQAIADIKSPQSINSKDLMAFILKLLMGIAAILGTVTGIDRLQ